MAVKFKKNVCVTDIANIKYKVWYQCTTKKWGVDSPILLQKIGSDTFFVIFSDESNGVYDSSSTLFDEEFIAFEVKLNIEVE